MTMEQSNEERYIKAWLDELVENNYVINYEEQPSFEIFPKITFDGFKGKKEAKITLLKERVYTADFLIVFNSKSIGLFANTILTNEDKLPKCHSALYFTGYFEVKASNWKDTTNTERFFLSRTQPLMWEKFGIYVNLIKPLDIFKQTFIPKTIMNEFYYKKDVYVGKGENKKLKARIGDKKHKFEYRTLTEYLHERSIV